MKIWPTCHSPAVQEGHYFTRLVVEESVQLLVNDDPIDPLFRVSMKPSSDTEIE